MVISKALLTQTEKWPKFLRDLPTIYFQDAVRDQSSIVLRMQKGATEPKADA